MKNARGQHGVGPAFEQHLGHVFQLARAAAGHHRHTHGFADATRDDEVEAGFRAVGVNGVQYNFARAECDGAFGPFHSVEAGFLTATGGTKAGFDLVITRRVSESVGVPVVASGGAGSLEHMAEVLLAGKADAVLAASIFHFGTFTVGDVKKFLAEKNIPVRL